MWLSKAIKSLLVRTNHLMAIISTSGAWTMYSVTKLRGDLFCSSPSWTYFMCLSISLWIRCSCTPFLPRPFQCTRRPCNTSGSYHWLPSALNTPKPSFFFIQDFFKVFLGAPFLCFGGGKTICTPDPPRFLDSGSFCHQCIFVFLSSPSLVPRARWCHLYHRHPPYRQC